MENQVSRYKYTSDFVLRAFNVRSNYEDHKIGYFDFLEFKTEPQKFYDLHSIMFPYPLSLFERIFDTFKPSSAYDMAETIIVSGPPRRITSITVPFLAIDSMVWTVGVTAVIAVSFVLMLNTILTKPNDLKTRNHHHRHFVGLILENIWTHSSLMCSEPIQRISSEITPRLVASSWLLSVTVILIFLGCYLKTEFTVESYGYINTLSELIESGIKPLWIDGSGIPELIEILAKNDDEVKKWLDGLDLEECHRSLPELLVLEGYQDIISGERALIISKLYMTWLLGEVLTGDPENKKMIAMAGGLYISKHNIRSEYMNIIYNSSWINSSPEMKENSHLSVFPVYETNCFRYLDFEYHYPLDYVTWTLPLKSTTSLSVSDLPTPFYQLLIFSSFTLGVLIAENLFGDIFKTIVGKQGSSNDRPLTFLY